MGFDFAYAIVLPRARLDALLGALAELQDDPSSLREVLPWAGEEAGRGVRGLHLGWAGIANNYDVCLRVPVEDDEMRAWVKQNPGLARDHGQASVGLVTLKVHAGQERAVVLLEAATSGMSLLFGESDSLRGVVLAMASAAGADAVFLDEEQDEAWQLVHPVEGWGGVHRRPGRDLLADVDGFAAEALREAGLPAVAG